MAVHESGASLVSMIVRAVGGVYINDSEELDT